MNCIVCKCNELLPGKEVVCETCKGEQMEEILIEVAPGRDADGNLLFDPWDDLTFTKHVLCPDCLAPTMGPYHDPTWNTYFSGHYCEECGITWHWDEKQKSFRPGL